MDMQGTLNLAVSFDPITGKGALKIIHTSGTISSGAHQRHTELNGLINRVFIFIFGINSISTIRIA